MPDAPDLAQHGEGWVSDFEPIGTGLTVYQDDAVVEGPLVWLDSPSEVLEFVAGGQTADAVVLARGGTTTFLTPALTAGVRGIMTLHGAPESHLGILSREYGIPCLMSVAFLRGTTTTRGETIPEPGSTVRMDVSTSPHGTVFVEVPAGGAPSGDGEPPPAPGDEADAPSPLAPYLARYRTRFPAGSAGDEAMRAELRTDALTLTGLDADSLTGDQLDDLIAYSGWNVWDMLGSRATEGESGLIPRQEYETIAGVEQFASYPEVFAAITDAVGPAGVVEMGAVARREVGTKVNPLHAWCCCMPLLTGRGFATGLGLCGPAERGAELAAALQFPRRLYRGLWGDEGSMFATGRGYEAPLLAGTPWIGRFGDEVTWFGDDAERAARRKAFNAETQLLAFLLHLDNRLGLADSGPYPQPDGTVLVVRDHFLHDSAYPWFDVASDLPHAVTQALYFRPPPGMRFTVNDLSTTFTRPSANLPYLVGTAVYARDRWDTPIDHLRLLDDDDLTRIAETARSHLTVLYQRYAAMTRDELIMAGVQMYVLDFVLPFLRLAGLGDEGTIGALGLRRLGPLAEAAYPLLNDAATAGELLPRVLIKGEGFVPVAGDDPVAAP